MECFSGQPDPAQLRGRFERLMEECDDETLRDDIALALAKALVEVGDTGDAIGILRRLAQDSRATMDVSLAHLWRGGMTEAEAALEKEIREYHSTNPDYTSDHALLLLASVFEGSGQAEEAWQVLGELMRKYPDGDRPEQDALFVEHVMRDRVRGFSGFDNPRAEFASLVMARRRPHLTCLVHSLALSRKLRKDTTTYVRVLEQIISLYGGVLSKAELSSYKEELDQATPGESTGGESRDTRGHSEQTSGGAGDASSESRTGGTQEAVSGARRQWTYLVVCVAIGVAAAVIGARLVLRRRSSG